MAGDQRNQECSPERNVDRRYVRTRDRGLLLPEMIILRKVLKVPLIATFAGVVALGILVVGYVFNMVM